MTNYPVGNLFIVGDSLKDVPSTLIELCETQKIVVLEYSSPTDFAVHLARDFHLAYEPGVVVCDLDTSHKASEDLLKTYRTTHPEGFLYFVFVGSQIKAEMAIDLMKTGSIDVILKPINDKKLVKEIEKAFALAQEKKSHVTQAILNLGRINQLTSKEISILVQILEGHTNKEIAKKMVNSSRTVEIHRASIFDKLDVKNAIELLTKLRT